jgi:hypothetical protein
MLRKTLLSITAVCLSALLTSAIQTSAQSKGSATSATRYFQLTLNLKSDGADAKQNGNQTIVTEVAVGNDKPGSCKARMIYQVPYALGSATKYAELGTKFDCNNVHWEGDGLSLDLVLETSRVIQMIKTKANNGVVLDEPLIGQRAVQLTTKLLLARPKVVFDSKSERPEKMRQAPNKADAITSNAAQALPPPNRDHPIVIELTATELK